MHNVHFDGSFTGWRAAARRLLHLGIPPYAVNWQHQQAAPDLFDQLADEQGSGTAVTIAVPRELPALLELAARFRADDRWALLYRILWRVSQGERAAMLSGDMDGSVLHRRIKAVHREVHHLHAFLRFQPRGAGTEVPAFVAWHEPAHDVLDIAVEHFAERMGNSTWLIATPDGAALWDGQQIRLLFPCPEELRVLAQQSPDTSPALWQTYYSSTFNPARLNPSVLERSMPVRFWKHLPEGPLIPRLMSQARAGAQVDGQAEAVAARAGKRIRAQRATANEVISGSDARPVPRH